MQTQSPQSAPDVISHPRWAASALLLGMLVLAALPVCWFLSTLPEPRPSATPAEPKPPVYPLATIPWKRWTHDRLPAWLPQAETPWRTHRPATAFTFTVPQGTTLWTRSRGTPAAVATAGVPWGHALNAPEWVKVDVAAPFWRLAATEPLKVDAPAAATAWNRSSQSPGMATVPAGGTPWDRAKAAPALVPIAGVPWPEGADRR